MIKRKSFSIALALIVLTATYSVVSFFHVHAEVSQTSVTIGVAQCSDGIDNDGDGLIDFPADPDCTSPFDDNEGPHAPPPSTSTPPGGGGGSVWYGAGSSTGGQPFPGGNGFQIFPPPPPQQSLPAKILRICDFNGDNACGIVDLSILLYYMGQPMPQAARYDLNNDGVIDVADISILFYYWS